MAPSQRLERMSDLLQEELSKIMDRELEFPDGALVTITRVEISPDKHYAAVFLSILGTEKKNILEILEKKVYNIQQLLNRRVRMRPVPRVQFAIDEGEEKREIIERSLAELKNNKEI